MYSPSVALRGHSGNLELSSDKIAKIENINNGCCQKCGKPEFTKYCLSNCKIHKSDDWQLL